MISLIAATIFMMSPQDDSGLPTIPPALPTQITKGDGTRLTCSPDYNVCWEGN